MQIKQVKPKLVALRDHSKLEALKELIRDAPVQPEIVVGDAGAVEAAVHPDAEAVITGMPSHACVGQKLFTCYNRMVFPPTVHTVHVLMSAAS